MRSTVEALEGNKVKVSVEVDEAEFEKAIDAAFKRIAREVRIPGFRPGKAPRRVLEARLGPEYGRSEALREALPEYYVEAVKEHEVDVIASPEFDITDGADAGAVTFDAVVEIRPTVTIEGYESLTVTLPSPVPSDEEIDIWNTFMMKRGLEDAVSEGVEEGKRLAGLKRRKDIRTFFELIDAEEGRR